MHCRVPVWTVCKWANTDGKQNNKMTELKEPNFDYFTSFTLDFFKRRPFHRNKFFDWIDTNFCGHLNGFVRVGFRHSRAPKWDRYDPEMMQASFKKLGAKILKNGSTCGHFARYSFFLASLGLGEIQRNSQNVRACYKSNHPFSCIYVMSIPI